MRPVVGITCYVEPARWGPWDARAALLPYTYVAAVTAAGGRAVVLPPDPDADVLTRLDALVLAGGADVGAARYGARPHPRTVDRPERDDGELALAAAALDADLPLLGVCRGAQLLAVACGGTLHQHLPDLVGGERHQPAPGVLGAHPARFAAGSRVAAFMGTAAEINSYHHQAVDDPGKLVVTGWADDGVVEAVEHPEAAFVVGVQWHPEESGDGRPFAALVAAARRGR
jgi:putative glutamine amidotransferase